MRRLAPIGLLALVWAACPRAERRAAEPEAAPEPAVERRTAAPEPEAAPEPAVERDPHEAMREHFDAVDAIKAALVDGDLATAQRAAAKLAEAPTATGLDDWTIYIDRMRALARDLQAARDVEHAAVAAARLGAACGQCHAELGHRPRLKRAPEPGADFAIAAQMQRHAWAADRMWEGLVVPSDELWQRGATAIAEASVAGDAPAGIEDQVAALRELGKAAAGASAPERADRFGALLGACGGCHRAAR